MQPLLLYTNLLKTEQAPVTGSSEASEYPASNVWTDNYAEVWRSTAAGASAETLTVDLGAAQDVDAVALGNVNFRSTATVTIAGNSADSWGAPAFGPETIVATGLDGVRRNLYHELSSSQNLRYWRISVTDNGNPDGFLEVGELWLGEQVTMTDSFDQGIEFTHGYANTEQLSDQGQSYVFERDRLVQIDARWMNIQAATRSELLALFRAVKGNALPFFFVFDPTSPAEAYFVKLTQRSLVERKVDFNVYEMSLSMIEQPVGLIVPKDV